MPVFESNAFDDHERVVFCSGRASGLRAIIAIHSTALGPAAGGIRMWQYASETDAIEDALRLARGMTHKNALAGLWWGGGKGVMAAPPGLDVRDPEIRRTVYRGYGRFITSLRGCYVTAEDVGTHVSDMANVFATTRHTTCIPPGVGGSGMSALAQFHTGRGGRATGSDCSAQLATLTRYPTVRSTRTRCSSCTSPTRMVMGLATPRGRRRPARPAR